MTTPETWFFPPPRLGKKQLSALNILSTLIPLSLMGKLKQKRWICQGQEHIPANPTTSEAKTGEWKVQALPGQLSKTLWN